MVECWNAYRTRIGTDSRSGVGNGTMERMKALTRRLLVVPKKSLDKSLAKERIKKKHK
jgi:hypothetical protein